MSVILVNAEAGKIPLPCGVVHCHCTSPPYWRQRDYSSKKEEEGDTQRRYWPEVTYRPGPGLSKITVPAGMYALGMEPTPELFIAHLVAVYDEVYRVTRADSAGWCVIGDCFWDSNRRRATRAVRELQQGEEDGQLVGIPAMLMKALQASGWYVRNDNVWHKVAPMPESVQGTHWQRCRVKIAPGRPPARQDHLPADGQRESGLRGNAWGDVQNQPNAQWADCPGCPKCEKHGGYVLRRGSWRHTRAHEVVLHLTKGMNYWSDQEAVREALETDPKENYPQRAYAMGRGTQPSRTQSPNTGPQQDSSGGYPPRNGGRNPRSVLTPAGEGGYPGAHYATFPANLIRPLIKSSCPTKCCPVCGAGWAVVVEKPDMSERPTRSDEAKYPTNGTNYSDDGGGTLKSAGQAYQEWRNANPDRVIDYRPTCSCAHDDWTPGLVLDPFVGSGTTLIVAREEGLNGIGLDLSEDYLHDQARDRLSLDAWDAWHGGGNGKEAANRSAERSRRSLEGLPLFEVMR